jgi:hypothetical protein
MFRLWGYKPKPDGKSDGYFCGYCVRIFNARYSTKQNPLMPGKCYTLSTVVLLVGANQLEHARFHGFLKVMIEHMIKHGGRDKVGQLPWESFDHSVLKMIEGFELKWQESDDVWDYPDYFLEHGDPKTNGKNHTETFNPAGKRVVLVPQKLGRVSRAFVRKTELERIVDSGTMQLSDNHMNERLQDLTQTISGVRGTGEKADPLKDLFARFELGLTGAASSSGGSSLVQPSGVGAPEVVESTGAFNFAFGFAPCAAAAVPVMAGAAAAVAAAAVETPAAGGRNKGRGRGKAATKVPDTARSMNVSVVFELVFRWAPLELSSV